MQHSSEVLGVTSENAVSVSPLRFAMRGSQSKQAKADATSNNQASKWLDTKHKAMRLKINMLLDQKPERMDVVLCWTCCLRISSLNAEPQLQTARRKRFGTR